MFKEMIKKKKLMSEEDAIHLLKHGRYGVLGTISDHGYPYTIPLNYVYINHKIYFHSAKIGHKIENIIQHPEVSFTVVGEESIIEKELTSQFKSVTLFGKARIIPNGKEILFELVKKYAIKMLEESKESIEQDFKHTSIIELEIEHITGKASG